MAKRKEPSENVELATHLLKQVNIGMAVAIIFLLWLMVFNS